MKALKCPMCTANLDVKEGANFAKCSYCETTVDIRKFHMPGTEKIVPQPQPQNNNTGRDPVRDMHVNKINGLQQIVNKNSKSFATLITVAIVFMIGSMFSAIIFLPIFLPIIFSMNSKHKKDRMALNQAKFEFNEYLKFKGTQNQHQGINNMYITN